MTILNITNKQIARDQLRFFSSTRMCLRCRTPAGKVEEVSVNYYQRVGSGKILLRSVINREEFGIAKYISDEEFENRPFDHSNNYKEFCWATRQLGFEPESIEDE